jgi:LytS/YehU family sensor histidine kinase
LVVQIKNNGPSIADNNLDKGFGIANIQERLRTQFEDDFKFSFSNLENEKGVITSIKLPLVLV